MCCGPATRSSCAVRSVATSPGIRRTAVRCCSSGVAPLMAMLRHRAATTSDVPTRLLSSSRSFEEIIYREELARLAADTTLEVVHTLTRVQPPDWTGYRRR